MVKYEKCLCCGSNQIEEGYMNTRIVIMEKEKTNEYGRVTQEPNTVKKGFICKECGYVAFLCDTKKNQ